MEDQIYDLVNNGNSITVDQLKKFIEIMFLNVSSDEISQVLEPLGQNVERDEFKKILKLLTREKATNLEVFNLWDLKKKGYIDKEDVKIALNNLGLNLKESFVDKMMNVFESDKICFEEFNKFVGKINNQNN